MNCLQMHPLGADYMSPVAGIQRSVISFWLMEKIKYLSTKNLFEQFVCAPTLKIHETLKMKTNSLAWFENSNKMTYDA